jgi:choline dehydrogenase-like flavoprotein
MMPILTACPPEGSAVCRQARAANYTGRGDVRANLAVIDGSILPTSLGVNPSLTIYPLAARNASTLVQRVRA